MHDFLAARPRLTAALGLALGALAGLAWFGICEFIADCWNPFA